MTANIVGWNDVLTTLFSDSPFNGKRALLSDLKGKKQPVVHSQLLPHFTRWRETGMNHVMHFIDSNTPPCLLGDVSDSFQGHKIYFNKCVAIEI